MALSSRFARQTSIVIPFYRQPELVKPLISSLASVSDELLEMDCNIIAINDSPDDAALRIELDRNLPCLAPRIPSSVIENPANLGFVRSVNEGLREAVKEERDVILLNSDTVVFPAAFREMQEVAYSDPMIGFVSPRSNNATICSLPVHDVFRKLPPLTAFEAFRDISHYLPRYHFAPTAIGFCLYIKLQILREFGFLDTAYGAGYNEENDLIMRANRCGFRAAIANHAFVYHVGESSFSVSATPKTDLDRKNADLLNARYPEYLPNVHRYMGSSHHQAERMLTTLIPDANGRLDVVFDFASVGCYHNGTFEAAKEILRRAAGSWTQFNTFVMMSPEAMRFHKLEALPRTYFVPPDTDRRFAVALRFGQPFALEHVHRMSRIAFANVYGMLDPIATDCLHLTSTELEDLWQTVFSYADGVIYISDFVQELFRRRFRLRPGIHELVTYLSLDYNDYADPAPPISDGHLLVVGNAFSHKRVPATVQALANAFPREKIVALGLKEHEASPNIVCCKSGDLSDEQVHELFVRSRIVIFPSLYEGFGIPIIRALAYGKPVLARDLPVTCAIQERINFDENLILYSSTDQLVNLLREGFPSPKPSSKRGDHSAGWQSIADRIGDFLHQIVCSTSVCRILAPRIEALRPVPPRPPDWDQSASQTIQELTRALRDREAWIQEIYNSQSWRLTAPIRAMGRVLLRRG